MKITANFKKIQTSKSVKNQQMWLKICKKQKDSRKLNFLIFLKMKQILMKFENNSKFQENLKFQKKTETSGF